MFLQVGVLPSDQPSLRFLSRKEPTTNVVVYQNTRHIFGSKDSPTCANYALQRTARDNAKFYPEDAEAVLENFYMDDYLDSVESPEKAVNRSKELVHLHLGGFKLTKFVSNLQNLADRMDGSPQSTEPKVIASCQEDSSHVLGLKWDHTNDTLVVSRGTSCAITKSLKQCLVLSLVSKVFDPIGLVASFTVGARLLLKDIWRVTGEQWDDELPQDMVQRFLVCSADLPKLENIKIPRSYFSGPFDNIELHMFGDSSHFQCGRISASPSKNSYGQRKNRACVSFGESARGANESNDCPKTRVTSSSTCRSTEKANYTRTYCNC